MIDSFKRSLHIKMIIIQLEQNIKDFEASIEKEKVDFDITQKHFNKHYDEYYQKLHASNIQNKKSKGKKQQKNEIEIEGQEVNENSFLNH